MSRLVGNIATFSLASPYHFIGTLNFLLISSSILGNLSHRYLLAIAQVDLKVLREMRLGAHLRSERAEEDETAFKIIEVCVCVVFAHTHSGETGEYVIQLSVIVDYAVPVSILLHGPRFLLSLYPSFLIIIFAFVPFLPVQPLITSTHRPPTIHTHTHTHTHTHRTQLLEEQCPRLALADYVDDADLRAQFEDWRESKRTGFFAVADRTGALEGGRGADFLPSFSMQIILSSCIMQIFCHLSACRFFVSSCIMQIFFCHFSSCRFFSGMRPDFFVQDFCLMS